MTTASNPSLSLEPLVHSYSYSVLHTPWSRYKSVHGQILGMSLLSHVLSSHVSHPMSLIPCAPIPCVLIPCGLIPCRSSHVAHPMSLIPCRSSHVAHPMSLIPCRSSHVAHPMCVHPDLELIQGTLQSPKVAFVVMYYTCELRFSKH
jgi:hypothetical protein